MIFDWLPESLNLASFFFLVGVSYLTSAITAALGIGGGITLLAIMANLLPIPAVIPVHGVVQLGSNLGRLSLLRRHVETRLLLWFALGSLLGSVLGGYLAVNLSGQWLRIAMGAFILYSAWLPAVKLASGRRALVGIATVTSFAGMVVGGVAPFIFAVIKDWFDDRKALVGTLAAMVSLQQGLKMLLFGFLGFTFTPWLVLIALMIATGYLGTLTGRIFLERAPARVVQPILKVVLTAMGLRLLYLGIWG